MLWGYEGALRVNRQSPITVINLSANGCPPVERCHRWSTVTATGRGALRGTGGHWGSVLANLVVWKERGREPGDYGTAVDLQLWCHGAVISVQVCVRGGDCGAALQGPPVTWATWVRGNRERCPPSGVPVIIVHSNTVCYHFSLIGSRADICKYAVLYGPSYKAVILVFDNISLIFTLSSYTNKHPCRCMLLWYDFLSRRKKKWRMEGKRTVNQHWSSALGLCCVAKPNLHSGNSQWFALFHFQSHP